MRKRKVRGTNSALVEPKEQAQVRTQEPAQNDAPLPKAGQGVGTATGYVEALAPNVGITGWAGMPGNGSSAAPPAPVTLALRAGERELARTQTGLSRNDVAGVHPGLGRHTGFAFSIEALLPLLTLRDLVLSEPLQVLAQDERLPSRHVWTVGDLVAVLQASVADVAAEHELLALPPHHALDLAWRRAVRWLLEPRQAAPQQVGVIEALALLPSQHVMVAGWWRRGTPSLVGVVVHSGGQRSAGALMSVQFDRPDLDSVHCGFVGVLRLSEPVVWVEGRPRFSLVLGGQHSGTMEPLAHARLLTQAAALQELETVRERPGATQADHAAALAAWVRELAPWHPDPASSAHLGVQAGVDQLWVIPGFGALLTGWVMAPVGTLVSVAARLGDAVLQSPSDGLSLRPRPDLRSALPQLADRSGHAGFAVVLRGLSHPDTRGAWWLKMGISDGSVFWLAVPMSQVRVVDQTFDIEQLARFDAGLENAPWVDDLVDAVWGGAVADVVLRHDHPLRPAAEVVMVQALPSRVSDLNLALDRLASVVPELARRGVGLVLIAPAQLRVAELESWAEVVRCWAPQLLLSWAWLPPTRNAWQVLPSVLRQLQAECRTTRFWFAGPRVLLTQAHAADLAEALVSSLGMPLPAPWFPGVQHLNAQGRTEVAQDAQLFAWEVEACLTTMPTRPAWMGGWCASNALGEPHAGQITERLGWQLGGAQPGPLARAINERRMRRWRERQALRLEGLAHAAESEARA